MAGTPINIKFTITGDKTVITALQRIKKEADKTIKSVEKLQRALNKFGKTKLAEVKAQTEGVRKQFDTAATSAKKLGTTTQRGAVKAQKSMIELLPHVAAVTLSYMAMRRAARAVTSTVVIGVQFEHEMAMVSAIVQATTKQFSALSDAAKEAGEQTVWSAKEAATALRFLAMAGFDVGESVTALRATLDLATIGELELKRATDIVTDVLRAFGKEATEIESVVNVFVGTITRSNTTVEAMGQAMKFVAPIAAQLKYSIEEVSAAIGILSTIGIKSGTAGRSYRMMLLRSADAAKLLGAETTRLGDVLKNLVSRKLGTDALAGAIKELFGLRATPATLGLMKNIAAWEEFTKKLKKASITSKEFIAYLDTTWMKFKRLASMVASIAIDAFEKYSDTLKRILVNATQWLSDHRDAILRVIDKIMQLGKTIAVGSIIIAGLAMLTSGAAAAKTAVTALGTAATITQKKLSLLFTGIIAYELTDWLQNTFTPVKKFFTWLTEQFLYIVVAFGAMGDLIISTWKWVWIDSGQIVRNAMTRVIRWIGEAMSTIADVIAKAFKWDYTPIGVLMSQAAKGIKTVGDALSEVGEIKPTGSLWEDYLKPSIERYLAKIEEIKINFATAIGDGVKKGTDKGMSELERLRKEFKAMIKNIFGDGEVGTGTLDIAGLRKAYKVIEKLPQLRKEALEAERLMIIASYEQERDAYAKTALQKYKIALKNNKDIQELGTKNIHHIGDINKEILTLYKKLKQDELDLVDEKWKVQLSKDGVSSKARVLLLEVVEKEKYKIIQEYAKKEQAVKNNTLQFTLKLNAADIANLAATEKVKQAIRTKYDKVLAQIQARTLEGQGEYINTYIADLIKKWEFAGYKQVKIDKLTTEMRRKLVAKFTMDRLKALQSMSEDMKDIIGKRYDYEFQLIQEQAKEHKLAGIDQNIVDLWVANEARKLLKEALIEYGGFTGGVQSYLLEMEDNWRTFYKNVGQLGYDTFSELGNAVKGSISKYLQGEANLVKDIWTNMLDSMLDKFTDFIADLVWSWAMSSLAQGMQINLNTSGGGGGGTIGGGLANSIGAYITNWLGTKATTYVTSAGANAIGLGGKAGGSNLLGKGAGSFYDILKNAYSTYFGEIGRLGFDPSKSGGYVFNPGVAPSPFAASGFSGPEYMGGMAGNVGQGVGGTLAGKTTANLGNLTSASSIVPAIGWAIAMILTSYAQTKDLHKDIPRVSGVGKFTPDKEGGYGFGWTAQHEGDMRDAGMSAAVWKGMEDSIDGILGAYGELFKTFDKEGQARIKKRMDDLGDFEIAINWDWLNKRYTGARLSDYIPGSGYRPGADGGGDYAGGGDYSHGDTQNYTPQELSKYIHSILGPIFADEVVKSVQDAFQGMDVFEFLGDDLQAQIDSLDASRFIADLGEFYTALDATQEKVSKAASAYYAFLVFIGDESVEAPTALAMALAQVDAEFDKHVETMKAAGIDIAKITDLEEKRADMLKRVTEELQKAVRDDISAGLSSMFGTENPAATALRELNAQFDTWIEALAQVGIAIDPERMGELRKEIEKLEDSGGAADAIAALREELEKLEDAIDEITELEHKRLIAIMKMGGMSMKEIYGALEGIFNRDGKTPDWWDDLFPDEAKTKWEAFAKAIDESFGNLGDLIIAGGPVTKESLGDLGYPDISTGLADFLAEELGEEFFSDFEKKWKKELDGADLGEIIDDLGKTLSEAGISLYDLLNDPELASLSGQEALAKKFGLTAEGLVRGFNILKEFGADMTPKELHDLMVAAGQPDAFRIATQEIATKYGLATEDLISMLQDISDKGFGGSTLKELTSGRWEQEAGQAGGPKWIYDNSALLREIGQSLGWGGVGEALEKNVADFLNELGSLPEFIGKTIDEILAEDNLGDYAAYFQLAKNMGMTFRELSDMMGAFSEMEQFEGMNFTEIVEELANMDTSALAELAEKWNIPIALLQDLIDSITLGLDPEKLGMSLGEFYGKTESGKYGWEELSTNKLKDIMKDSGFEGTYQEFLDALRELSEGLEGLGEDADDVKKALQRFMIDAVLDQMNEAVEGMLGLMSPFEKQAKDVGKQFDAWRDQLIDLEASEEELALVEERRLEVLAKLIEKERLWIEGMKHDILGDKDQWQIGNIGKKYGWNLEETGFWDSVLGKLREMDSEALKLFAAAKGVSVEELFNDLALLKKYFEEMGGDLLTTKLKEIDEAFIDMLNLLSPVQKEIIATNKRFDDWRKELEKLGAAEAELADLEEKRAIILAKLVEKERMWAEAMRHGILGDTDTWAAQEVSKKYGWDIDAEGFWKGILDVLRNASMAELKAFAESRGVGLQELFEDLGILKRYFEATGEAAVDFAGAIKRIEDMLDRVNEDIKWYNWQIAHGGMGIASRAEYLMERVNEIRGMENPTITDVERMTQYLIQWYDAAVAEATEAARKAQDAEREEERLAKIWIQVAERVEDLVESIDDAIRNIKYSGLNVGLPYEKRVDAQEDYSALLAKAQTGGVGDVQKYLSFASTYLQQSQEDLKSSQAYQDTYARVLADMEAIKARAEAGDYDQLIYDELIASNVTQEDIVVELGAINDTFKEVEAWIRAAIEDIELVARLLIEFKGIQPGDAAAILAFFQHIIDTYGWDSNITLRFIGVIDWGMFTTEVISAYLNEMIEAVGWDSLQALRFIGSINWGKFTTEEIIAHLNTISTLEEWQSPAVLLFLHSIDWGEFTIDEILAQMQRISDLDAWTNATRLVFTGAIDWGELEPIQLQAAINQLFEGLTIDTDIALEMIAVMVDDGIPWGDLKAALIAAGYSKEEVEKALKLTYLNETGEFATWDKFWEAWSAIGMATEESEKLLRAIYDAEGAGALKLWSDFLLGFNLAGGDAVVAEKIIKAVYTGLPTGELPLWSDFEKALLDLYPEGNAEVEKKLKSAYEDMMGEFPAWADLERALLENGTSTDVIKKILGEYESGEMTWAELQAMLKEIDTPDAVIRKILADVRATTTVELVEIDIWKVQTALLMAIVQNTARTAIMLSGGAVSIREVATGIGTVLTDKITEWIPGDMNLWTSGGIGLFNPMSPLSGVGTTGSSLNVHVTNVEGIGGQDPYTSNLSRLPGIDNNIWQSLVNLKSIKAHTSGIDTSNNYLSSINSGIGTSNNYLSPINSHIGLILQNLRQQNANWKYPDTGGILWFKEGGIATGPESGYPVMLHGTELIIPLKEVLNGGSTQAGARSGDRPLHITVEVAGKEFYTDVKKISRAEADYVRVTANNTKKSDNRRIFR